jgi:hypothetical protein
MPQKFKVKSILKNARDIQTVWRANPDYVNRTGERARQHVGNRRSFQRIYNAREDILGLHRSICGSSSKEKQLFSTSFFNSASEMPRFSLRSADSLRRFTRSLISIAMRKRSAPVGASSIRSCTVKAWRVVSAGTMTVLYPKLGEISNASGYDAMLIKYCGILT